MWLYLFPEVNEFVRRILVSHDLNAIRLALILDCWLGVKITVGFNVSNRIMLTTYLKIKELFAEINLAQILFEVSHPNAVEPKLEYCFFFFNQKLRLGKANVSQGLLTCVSLESLMFFFVSLGYIVFSFYSPVNMFVSLPRLRITSLKLFKN